MLILGLDNAGKTTVLRKFCGEPIDTIEPTLGFNIQTLEYQLRRQHNGNDDNNALEGNLKAAQESNSHYQNNSVNGKTTESADGPVYQLHFWDVGGQKSIRAYWRNYFEQTDGLIWVVDSADRVRLDLCRQELAQLLQQERLAGASLLILANKQDVDGALSANEIAQVLEMETSNRYQNRHSCIVPCSAVTGEGLEKGMEWLVGDISSRIFMLS